MSAWGWGQWNGASQPFINPDLTLGSNHPYEIPQYKQMSSQFRRGAAQYGARTDVNDPFRQGQIGEMQNLQGVIEGTAGPSVAEQQLKQTTDENIKNQMAMAASYRGATNPGLATRNVAEMGVNTQQQAAGQAATMRAKEVADARDRLGQLMAQGRSQDQALTQMNDEMVKFNQAQGMNLNLAQADARMRLQETLASIQSDWNRLLFGEYEARKSREMESKELLNSTIFNAIGSAGASDYDLKTDVVSTNEIPSGSTGGGGDSLMSSPTFEAPQTTASTDFGGTSESSGEFGTEHGQATGDTGTKVQTGGGYTGRVGGPKNKAAVNVAAILGSGLHFPQQRPLAVYSDEKLKTDEGKSKNILTDFLDSLEPVHYRYKDPQKFGEGPRYGVIAQDVEKTPVGQTFVRNTPEGKMLDQNVGFGVILASLANLNDRVRNFEGKKNG